MPVFGVHRNSVLKCSLVTTHFIPPLSDSYNEGMQDCSALQDVVRHAVQERAIGLQSSTRTSNRAAKQYKNEQ